MKEVYEADITDINIQDVSSPSKTLKKKMNRAESVAYPKTGFLAKVNFLIRKNSRAVLATFAFVAFVLILSLDAVQKDTTGSNSLSALRNMGSKNFVRFGGAMHQGYFTLEKSMINENQFRFAAVTDLDQLSRVADSSKPLFKSLLLPGILTRDPTTSQYSIEFEEIRTLTSKHNEAGRGMELSELTVYDNRLLSFDDRTGTVFEILSEDKGKSSFVAPRFVITEGSGDTDKGMKWEWASVKNGELYMGSFGKEYTREDGSIANTNNLWIDILSHRGELRRLDWSENYNFVRAKLGASSPGYVIHEAILWSSHLNQWVFVPRRVSSDAYDENADERKGSDKLVLVDESFTTAKVVDIKMKEVDPLHGFSTIAFVPGTRDRHILAVRTVEEDCVGGDESLCKQRSYFLVFNVLTGEVLMEETKYPTEGYKFEGVEFVDIYTPEPY